jgi:hypothetical protein
MSAIQQRIIHVSLTRMRQDWACPYCNFVTEQSASGRNPRNFNGFFRAFARGHAHNAQAGAGFAAAPRGRPPIPA